MYTKRKQNPLLKYISIYDEPSDNQIFTENLCIFRSHLPDKPDYSSRFAPRTRIPARKVYFSFKFILKFVHSPTQPPLRHHTTTSAALRPAHPHPKRLPRPQPQRPTSKKQKRRPRRPPPIIISVLIRRAYSSASPIFPTTTATAAQAATATTAMAANFANAFILLPPCSFDFLYHGCAGTHRIAPEPTGLPGIRQPHLTLQTHHTQKPQDRLLSSLPRPHCCIMA